MISKYFLAISCRNTSKIVWTVDVRLFSRIESSLYFPAESQELFVFCVCISCAQYERQVFPNVPFSCRFLSDGNTFSLKQLLLIHNQFLHIKQHCQSGLIEEELISDQTLLNNVYLKAIVHADCTRTANAWPRLTDVKNKGKMWSADWSDKRKSAVRFLKYTCYMSTSQHHII